MATYDVSLSQYFDGELGGSFNASPTSLTVARGDTIRFTRSDLGGSSQTMTVSGFTTARFTSATNITLSSNGAVGSRIVRADATLGSFSLTASAGSLGSITISITITSGLDTTPDDFSFAAATLAQPGSLIESNVVTITGINTAVSVSVNAGSFMADLDGVWRTSGTILQGQKLQLRLGASGAYNATTSMTVTVGTVSRSFSVTTANDPGSGEIIPFPFTSGELGLNNIIDFFGGVIPLDGVVAPRNLRAYMKGAGYVPNIAQNGNIPSSGNLSVRQFLGSATALYFLRYPGFRSAGGSTVNGAVTPSVDWSYAGANVSYNPRIGFGSIAASCEYRYRVLPDAGSTLNVVSSISGSINAFSAWGTEAGIVLSVTVPFYTEHIITGTVEFQVRHRSYPSVVLSASARYSLSGVGP
jgi:hypothetical protein